MNNTVTRPQGNAAAGLDKIRQGMLGVDVHRFGIGGGVAERLHDEIGSESQTCQVLEFVTGHRASCVLAAYSSHLGLTVASGSYPIDTTGASHHFLRQGVTLIRFLADNRRTEYCRGFQSHVFPRSLRKTTSDD